MVEIRLIMRPCPVQGMTPHWPDCFLVYARRFDVVSQNRSGRELSTGMHVLRRAKRGDGQYIGDVIPVSQLRSAANLIPRFGPDAANPRLTRNNSHECSEEFWLNKYWNKDFYYTLNVEH